MCSFSNTAAQLGPKGSDCLFVISIGCPNKLVILDTSLTEKVLEDLAIMRAEFQSVILTSCCCFLLDFQAVLVGPGAEVHFVTIQLMIPSDRIAQEHCVKVTNMRLGIDIEDGRCYVHPLREVPSKVGVFRGQH